MSPALITVPRMGMLEIIFRTSAPKIFNYDIDPIVKRCKNALSDPNRENTLHQAQRLHKAKEKLLESYHRVKNAFKTLQDKYSASKDNINVLQRYSNMKRMIKEVTILEKQYWTLLVVPKQDGNESQSDYIFRIVNFLDQRIQESSNDPPPQATGLSGLLGQTAHLAEKAREANFQEQLKAKSTDELRKECAAFQNDIFRIIKKYSGLRALVVQLKAMYDQSKGYPIVPRYTMLKDMIKNVLRSPAFVEICHEQEE